MKLKTKLKSKFAHKSNGTPAFGQLIFALLFCLISANIATDISAAFQRYLNGVSMDPHFNGV